MRPYQLEIMSSIWNSVIQKQGLTFSIEIARQGGKNEISARLETFLLYNFMAQSKNLIKCSPTFQPQTLISLARLKDKLNEAKFTRCWHSESGHILALGRARAIFLSADRSANVVGNTAHLLLEVDEAQDVSEEKYQKEFRPMGSTTNVTNVLYGTTWDDSTLLEKIKQTNLELERLDGIQRHFRYDWQEVAKYNPDYLTYVESERSRLGEDHPLFLTQYRLLPVHGGGRFFNSIQKAQLQGHHSRCRQPEPGKIYVAGIDLAGEAECAEDDFLKFLQPSRDSTVITLAELTFSPNSLSFSPNPLSLEKRDTERFEKAGPHNLNPLLPFAKGRIQDGFSSSQSSLPSSGNFLSLEKRDTERFEKAGPHNPKGVTLERSQGSLSPGTYNLSPNTYHLTIVEHYVWTGIRHSDLYPQLLDLLKNVWNCRRVVVDSTGIGQPVASFLRQALGTRVVPFEFTAPSKSELGFDLLAAVNSGRLKMYAPDNSPEYQEFCFEVDKAKSHYRPSRTLNFFVDPSEGHDDYLMSLALVVRAGRLYKSREAKGK